jgi:4-hydroxy 2-oxovalerate aldolase
MSLKILDCTLRDGAHVNQGRFGLAAIKNVIQSLEFAKIDIIEIGFLQDVVYDEDVVFFDSITRVESLIASCDLVGSADISLMVRPDRCSIDRIDSIASTVNTIRFAFYAEDFDKVPAYFNHARSLGYKCFLNPVAITTYSHDQIKNLLNSCAELKPDGISIVDTFGGVTLDSFRELVEIFNERLSSAAYLGVHLHENLSLSFGLVQDYLKTYFGLRDTIIDCSLLGMGRIPGNTPTELVLDLVNRTYKGSYDIQPIMNVISDVINIEMIKRGWGYSPEYMLSGSLNVHRSYAEFFVEHRGLDLKSCAILMEMISSDGRGARYNENYAVSLIEKL